MNGKLPGAALLILIPAFIFAMGARLQKIPMKPFSGINIPDGEFLHYDNYNHGEKYGDTYMVIRRENDGGGTFYRIFKADIQLIAHKTLPADYRNWPSSFLIDPARGSVLEASENTGLEARDDNSERVLNYDFFNYPGKGYAGLWARFSRALRCG